MVFNKGKLLFAVFIIFKFIIFIEPAYSDISEISSLILSLPQDHNSPIDWYERGKILYRLGAYQEAAKAFSHVDGEIPEDLREESLYLKADSLIRMGKNEEATNIIDLISKKSIFYPFNLYIKGMANLSSGKEKDALRYLESVSEYYPPPRKFEGIKLIENLAIDTHLRLGFIYLEKGLLREAIRHFAIIPEESNIYVKALFGAGWAYARMERWIRAVIFWEELVYKFPDSRYAREIMPYIGFAYKKLSAYGKAIEQNNDALKYYEKVIQELAEIEEGITTNKIDSIFSGVELLGDRTLIKRLQLYNTLLDIEEYITKKHIKEPIKDIISKRLTEEKNRIIDNLSKKLPHKIEELRFQMIETSIETLLNIANNLRLEGSGHISKDMVFSEP